MSTRGIARNATVIGYATPTNAPIYVDSDDNRVKVIPAGSGTTEVILQEASGAGSAEELTAVTTLDASDSGKTFFLNSATEFAVTLPAPAIGLRFTFFVKAAPSGANYTVVTAGSPDQILAGQVYASSGTDEDSETDFTGTTITFVGGTSVIGDSADVWSDGTNWYARAYCNATGGITIDG